MEPSLDEYTRLHVCEPDSVLLFFTKDMGFSIVENPNISKKEVRLNNKNNNRFSLSTELSASDLPLSSRSTINIYTNDCMGDYDNLKKKDIYFLGEPCHINGVLSFDIIDQWGNRYKFIEGHNS
jgi:hypothetical protein